MAWHPDDNDPEPHRHPTTDRLPDGRKRTNIPVTHGNREFRLVIRENTLEPNPNKNTTLAIAKPLKGQKP
jgi:hypothetical protein